jgi:hypothetical protein
MKRNRSTHLFSTGSGAEADESGNTHYIVVSVMVKCLSEQEFIETVFAFIFFINGKKSDSFKNDSTRKYLG